MALSQRPGPWAVGPQCQGAEHIFPEEVSSWHLSVMRLAAKASGPAWAPGTGHGQWEPSLKETAVWPIRVKG